MVTIVANGDAWNRSWRRIALQVALLFSIFVVTLHTQNTASANGGQIRVDEAQLGPYVVSIFTDPSPIRVGTVDISTLVEDQATGELVADVEVVITAEPITANAEPGTWIASQDQSDDLRYISAKFELPSAGRWQINVSVEGEEGGGNTSFEVVVENQRGFGLLQIIIGLMALPIIIGIIWYFWSRGSDDSDEDEEFEEQPVQS